MEWKIPTSIMQQDASIRVRIDQVIIPHQPLEDRLVWCSSKDGYLSAKQAYEFLNPPLLQLRWTVWIWHTFVPPSSSFVAWRCFHNKMPTDENLMKRGCIIVSLEHAASTIGYCGGNPCAALHMVGAEWHTLQQCEDYVTDCKDQNFNIKLSSMLASGLSNGTEKEILQQLFVAPRPATSSVRLRLVLWKSPTIGWMKVNTDVSVITTSAASGARGSITNQMETAATTSASEFHAQNSVTNMHIINNQVGALVLHQEGENRQGQHSINGYAGEFVKAKSLWKEAYIPPQEAEAIGLYETLFWPRELGFSV
ncbi:ribonuclease H [Trifolium pratense]|uniref:Ribonuclease H n=1 Tax=Trifolium pratense TaxID=57577 RepID=A0A2K3MTP5_TRIPR|nr:ribonuclease H [Trifolium pratense]